MIKKTILCIDDSRMTVKLLRDTLASNPKYKDVVVHESNQGFNGISDIINYSPDLVFMDFEMPILNGLEAMSIIRQNPKYKDLDILFFSSKDNVFDKIRGTMIGGTEYFSKNTQRERLNEIFEKET